MFPITKCNYKWIKKDNLTFINKQFPSVFLFVSIMPCVVQYVCYVNHPQINIWNFHKIFQGRFKPKTAMPVVQGKASGSSCRVRLLR